MHCLNSQRINSKGLGFVTQILHISFSLLGKKKLLKVFFQYMNFKELRRNPCMSHISLSKEKMHEKKRIKVNPF